MSEIYPKTLTYKTKHIIFLMTQKPGAFDHKTDGDSVCFTGPFFVRNPLE